MPGFLSRSAYAAPMWLADDNGNPLGGVSNPVQITGGGTAQATVVATKYTLAANTAVTIATASAAASGARVLNWTASPVYITSGTTGTPASGSPSDYVPAAASGVPGQWEPPYRPVDGLRAVGASAGDLTVVTF